MTKRTALTALLLILPAQTVGVIMGIVIYPDTFIGNIAFTISKLWIFCLPLAWLMVIEKERPALAKPPVKGLIVGTILGLLIGAIIIAAYLLIGRTLIDPQEIKDMAVRINLDSKTVFFAGAAYWILINSVLEEYVWRWFVVKQCEKLMPPIAAIFFSAACFTVHHIFATQVYFSGVVVAITTAGIFIGGAAWSWCYIKYRSIWPGYISHAIVDLAIFAIAYRLIFL